MRNQHLSPRQCDQALAALCVALLAIASVAASAAEDPKAPETAAPTAVAAPAAPAQAGAAENPKAAATEAPAPAAAPTEPAAAGAAKDSEAPKSAASAPAAYSRKGADTCLGCHDDVALQGLFRTAHGRPTDARAPFGHGQLQCEACHGPGDAHAKFKGKGDRPWLVDFGRKAKSPAAVQDAQCLACHRGSASHWAGNAHAANDVSCAGCHQSHTARDPVRILASQEAICAICHLPQHADTLKPSRHPLLEGKMACSTCHAPHGSTGPAQLVKNSVNETCTSCHTEYRGPFLWDHAPVAEDCGNCHLPHGSVQPAMLKSRPPFLCQACHQAQGHPSVAYTPDGLPGGGGPAGGAFLLAGGCVNCHSQVHGSNHPSGSKLMR
jgi:DmsE family decaheme c-type cytochrome